MTNYTKEPSDGGAAHTPAAVRRYAIDVDMADASWNAREHKQGEFVKHMDHEEAMRARVRMLEEALRLVMADDEWTELLSDEAVAACKAALASAASSDGSDGEKVTP